MDNKSDKQVRFAEKASGESTTKALPDLTGLRAAVSNGALKGGPLPGRLKIFNWGENASTKGTFTVGNKSAERLAANQRALGYERVALEYNHCSVPGSPEYEKLMENGQPPIIFGYGRPHLIAGDGLYLEEMEWTPLGVERARNFEDLSPAAAFDCGEIDFIHSVALTTNGCLHDVTFFSANNKQNMNTQNKNDAGGAGVITLAMLAGALGLPVAATEEDVTGKLRRLSALEPLGELLARNGKTVLLSGAVDGKTLGVGAEEILRLSARVETLETELRAGGQAARQVECGKILSLLSAEGKAPVNPDTGKAYAAEELKRLDVAMLRLLHANTPVTVPLRARTQGTGTAGVDPNLRGRARFIAAQEAANVSKQ